MINVLQIISNMGDGGAQKIILNYINDLEEDKDINLNLLILANDNNNPNDEILKIKNIKITYLDCFNKKFKFKILQRIYDIINVRKKINKYLKNNRVDIVHVHLFGTLLYVLEPIIKSKIKVRFYTLHSDPKRFNGYKLKILKKAFNRGKFVPVCVTNEQVLTAKEHYKISNYEVVHNGIDVNKIKKSILSKKVARKKFNISDRDFLICSVGRLETIKRYDLLLEIFNNILKKKNNSRLLIAGDGTELNNLKQISKNLGIQDKVTFLGNIDNVIELYSASDVLVITSTSESASLVLLEAQLCNLKAVISNGTPSESIITKNVIKMREKATVDEWTNTIICGKKTEIPTFNESDYEIHSMSQKMKKIYIKYWSDIYEQK